MMRNKENRFKMKKPDVETKIMEISAISCFFNTNTFQVLKAEMWTFYVTLESPNDCMLKKVFQEKTQSKLIYLDFLFLHQVYCIKMYIQLISHLFSYSSLTIV